MIAEVIVDVTASEVDKIFDYNLPDDLKIAVGSRVFVPFGTRTIEGYIVNLKPTSILPKAKIKNIIKACDAYPIITSEMLELANFMKMQYNLKMVDILRLFLPSSMRLNKVKAVIKEKVFISKNIDVIDVLKNIKANATKQRQLVEYLIENKEAEKTFLNNKFGSVVVNKFLKSGVLNTQSYEVKRSPEANLKTSFKHNVELTKEQTECVNAVLSSKSQTFLLHGVTGSGKTEVYMQVIKEMLNQNKTAIMLVPEISLTPQMLKNFRERFGELVAVIHSGLTDGERYDEWRRIKEGNAKIVIGARSAVFAPIKNLGVIIIDEEHDSSYYSESNPRYFTHDIAKFRAEFNECNLVLGSATPSVESYYFAKQNEYKLLELPFRVNKKQMPDLKLVDMKTELMLGNSSMFSTELKHELEKTIEQNNQAMIFINRRGFSSFLRCTECGYVPKCTDCDVSLVYHKYDEQLKCHFCNKRYSVLNKCPECGGNKLREGGVGTQKIVEELKTVFPQVKILRMDNDTTTNKNAHSRILSEFVNSKPSILVGTQMIAKGHDFPSVTLVGIIDADLSLHFNDYRATERTFQLITQVAGRAGRELKTGKVILQTYTPKHYVYYFASSYDYKAFYQKEINLRETTNFPPFTKIIRVLISGETDDKTQMFLKEFYDKIKEVEQRYKSDFIYLEAMKSPVKRIKAKFRYQILMRLKLEKQEQILNEIFYINDQMRGRAVSSFIEIEPQNLS